MSIVLFLQIRQGAAGWPGVIIVLLVILFVVHLFATTNYSVEGNILTVKSGFLYNRSIDILTIRKVSETTNPLSAPAISLDRLEIKYGKFDSVLISPKLKKEFISELASLNPNIEIKLKFESGSK